MVLTDAKRGDAIRVSRNLEALHSVLQAIAAEERRGPKTLVYAFRSTRLFQDYNPFSGRKTVAGFFTTSMLRNFLAIDLTKGRRGGTVYHELLHEFAATNFPGVPLWFNEGLAEYYSTFVLNGDQAEVGRAIENHLSYLRSIDLLPMRNLLSVTTDSREYNESERNGRFYAQSWATVHFLLSDNGRASQLREFLRKLDAGTQVEKAFVEAFSLTLEEFDASVEQYVDQRSFQFLRVPTEALETTVAVRSADRSETLARLGELLAAEQQTDKAREHLQAALDMPATATSTKRGVANARAILGWLAWMEGNREEARRLFGQSSSDPTSVAPRLYRGMLELDLVFQEAEIGTRESKEHPWAEAAQTSLMEALALEPDWPKAQVSLGMSFLYRGDAQEGIEILNRATELRPQDPMGWLGIALLSAKAGEYSRAWNLLEQLEDLRARLPGSSALAMKELIPTGRDTVAVFQMNQVFELFNDRDDEAALSLAQQLENRLTQTEVQRFANHLERVRSRVWENRTIEQFNTILKSATPGNYQRALERLNALLEQEGFGNIHDGKLLERAKDLQKELIRAIE